MRCVLLGLQVCILHTLGWVHGDVRWPNIVRITADSWCLIDLDHARKLSLDAVAHTANDLHEVVRLFDAKPCRSSFMTVSSDAMALGHELASDTTDIIETLLGHVCVVPWVAPQGMCCPIIF